jgi:hypothetical protein
VAVRCYFSVSKLTESMADDDGCLGKKHKACLPDKYGYARVSNFTLQDRIWWKRSMYTLWTSARALSTRLPFNGLRRNRHVSLAASGGGARCFERGAVIEVLGLQNNACCQCTTETRREPQKRRICRCRVIAMVELHIGCTMRLTKVLLMTLSAIRKRPSCSRRCHYYERSWALHRKGRKAPRC